MSDALKNRVSIHIVEGPLSGKTYEVETYDTFVMGRAPDCQISIPDDSFLSRYHLRLEIKPPVCHLIDLDSRNGTRVNGVKVSSASLVQGDAISLGATKLVIAEVQAPEKPSAATVQNLTSNETLALEDPNATIVSIQDVAPIPGYELLDFLGRGAMGAVYKALQKGTEEFVALKIIAPQFSDHLEPKTQQMFMREASVLGKLQHRRIVEFHEFGMQDAQMYIAMEFVETFDLAIQLLEAPIPTRMRIACGTICYVLDALSYAHRNNVVHRDVKPTNILPFKKNGKVRAKLTDFGLAKNFLTAGFSDITQENQGKGTLAYIAPEQLIDCRAATPACDIYSAGACLYHYLSGELAHDRKGTGVLTLSSILNDDPVPLIERMPSLPGELCDAIMRTMERDPEKRFRTAHAFRRALLPFIKKESST